MLIMFCCHCVRACVCACFPTGEIKRQLGLSEAGVIVTVPKLLPAVQEAVSGSDVVIIN